MQKREALRNVNTPNSALAIRSRRSYGSLMPPPIDWSAAGGLDSVKQLTITLGPREAARRLKLSPSHAEALKRACSRGNWMDAVRPQVVPMPASMSQAVKVTVPVVPTASEALANTLLEDGNATKVAGMKFARRTVEAAADLASADPLKALVSAGDVKASLQSAAIAGNWAGSGSPSLRLTMFGPSGPVVDVESSYSPE